MADKIFSSSYTEKVTPADNDFVLLTDSADGDKVKKGRFINFKGADSTVPGPAGNGIESITTNKVGKTTTVTITEDDSTVTQFQLQDGADGTGSGDISGSGTANEIAYFTSEKVIDNLPVATYPNLTELSYVKGVTSSIQTQLNGKQASGSYVPTSRQLTINGTAYDLSADRSWTISAGGTYWTAITGTRTGNNTFTLVGDQSGLISRGTVVKWTESSVIKQAMVITSVYSSVTTVTLVGDTMASIDSNSLKYGAVKAKEVTFAYLPTVGTGTDIMGRWFAGEKTKVHGAIAYHGTAGTTNATTYDVNKNGTTIFTTKLSVASGSTVGSDTSADSTSYLDTNDYLTIDCGFVSTTAPVYATIKVFVSPFNDIYLA